MTETVASRPPRIFQHASKRAEWGYAVLLEELPDKRTFRFEDGSERSFRNDYFHKMEMIELPPEEASEVAARAMRGVSVADARRAGLPRKVGRAAKPKTPKVPKKPDVSFEEQMERWRALHPLGFDDVTYRTGGKGKAIRRAKKTLTAETFGAQVEQGEHEAAHAAAVAVLDAWKSAMSKGDRDAVGALTPEGKVAFVTSLSALLFGEAPYAQRFDAFVRELGKLGLESWRLSTIFPALCEPEQHLFVRDSSLRKQALVVDVVPGPMNPPRSTTYERLLSGAVKVRERLVELGETPKDLFDIVVFAKKTLTKPVATA